MRLMLTFLAITIICVYCIDHSAHREIAWKNSELVRIEGKYCPLYFPKD